jgi:excisionase family DNA binding protein
MIPELLSEKEAAAKLNVTPGTLSVWRATKRYALRYIKIGRKVRYRPQDIEAFIEARLMPGDGSRPRRGSARGTHRGSR